MQKDCIWSLYFSSPPPPPLQSGFCTWIQSCNTLLLMPPTVLRIQCKHHMEDKRLFRLYPDSVQHAITAHTVDTRNDEPLTVPNSMPLCFSLLPWNVLSVQLPPPQIYVWLIPTHFLRLSAGISSRKPFLTPPIPTSLCWVLFWVFWGILGLPSAIWWSGHLVTLLSPKPGPFSYTY